MLSTVRCRSMSLRHDHAVNGQPNRTQQRSATAHPVIPARQIVHFADVEVIMQGFDSMIEQ